MTELYNQWNQLERGWTIQAWGMNGTPAYARICRINNSLSDIRDTTNHVWLNEKQQQAYEEAFLLLKENKPLEAASRFFAHQEFGMVKINDIPFFEAKEINEEAGEKA